MGIKKRLAGAAMAAGIGVAAISGGTFALFTAEASNTGNTFTAGTVVISDATGGAALSTTSFISNLAPGDNETATLSVTNNGNLDAWVAIDSATNNNNGIANDNIGDLFEGANPLTISYDTAPVRLAPGATATFNVGYSFPLAAGNEYQGDTGEVTFNVKAVQARNNTLADGSGPIAWN